MAISLWIRHFALFVGLDEAAGGQIFQILELIVTLGIHLWKTVCNVMQCMLIQDRERAHFLMLRTRSAAAGSFIFSRNSAKLRDAVASASSLSSAIVAVVPPDQKSRQNI